MLTSQATSNHGPAHAPARQRQRSPFGTALTALGVIIALSVAALFIAAAGTPMRTLQHWKGHADSRTTQIYAHHQPSDQEADAVDRAFS